MLGYWSVKRFLLLFDTSAPESTVKPFSGHSGLRRSGYAVPLLPGSLCDRGCLLPDRCVYQDPVRHRLLLVADHVSVSAPWNCLRRGMLLRHVARIVDARADTPATSDSLAASQISCDLVSNCVAISSFSNRFAQTGRPHSDMHCLTLISLSSATGGR